MNDRKDSRPRPVCCHLHIAKLISALVGWFKPLSPWQLLLKGLGLPPDTILRPRMGNHARYFMQFRGTSYTPYLSV